MQEALKAPDDYPEDDEGGEDEDGDGDVNMGDADDEEEIEEWTNAERIRRNPETYLFFSVGYWYFQQTKWSQNTNQRWSFHNGAGEQVQL